MDATNTFIAFVVLAGAFMLLRHVILWYWRINEAVDLLHSINRNLELMAGSREPKAEYGPEVDVGSAASANE
jgi:hypothetical protein